MQLLGPIKFFLGQTAILWHCTKHETFLQDLIGLGSFRIGRASNSHNENETPYAIAVIAC